MHKSKPKPTKSRMLIAAAALVAALAAETAAAQGLFPPTVPPGNPITPAKAQLGKALFWDEQLSSTRTVACGTCHIPSAGGADPRAALPGAPVNPGPDQIFGTGDDVRGSAGVRQTRADGTFEAHPGFGFEPQVTGRKSPSMINAVYSPELFWDGRASDIFIDPDTGEVLLPYAAALESQALGPLLDTGEMGHLGRELGDVTARVEESRPLSLALSVPASLEQWIGGRSYPELFDEAFGSPEVTAARIAMAIATYERTLISDQSPFDRWLQGIPDALTPEQELGLQLFDHPHNGCISCHQGPCLTDDLYHYIGLRPHDADPGRFAVTGEEEHRGQMRTPGLRNVGLRGPYFHDGSAATLEEVIDYYERGGEFDGHNKDARIRELELSPLKKEMLVTFLREALTDPRVEQELFPFDRPTLSSELARAPLVYGAGTPGSGGHVPAIVALEPPRLGSSSFTLGVQQALGGAPAMLLIGYADDRASRPFLGALVHVALDGTQRLVHRVLEGTGHGAGSGSLELSLSDHPLLAGMALRAQWLVRDPEAPGGLAASEAMCFELF